MYTQLTTQPLAIIHAMYSGTVTRAATDPADPDPDPDPDLLTTRIQKSRSGSVKKTFLQNLVQKFGHLKFVLKFFYQIPSLIAAVLKFL